MEILKNYWGIIAIAIVALWLLKPILTSMVRSKYFIFVPVAAIIAAIWVFVDSPARAGVWTGIILSSIGLVILMAYAKLIFTFAGENEVIAVVIKSTKDEDDPKKNGVLLKHIVGIPNYRVKEVTIKDGSPIVENGVLIDLEKLEGHENGSSRHVLINDPKVKNRGILGLGIHYAHWTYGIISRNAKVQLTKMSMKQNYQNIAEAVEIKPGSSNDMEDHLTVEIQHPLLARNVEMKRPPEETEEEVKTPTTVVAARVKNVNNFADILIMMSGRFVILDFFFFVHKGRIYEVADQIIRGAIDQFGKMLSFDELRNNAELTKEKLHEAWRLYGMNELLVQTGLLVLPENIEVSDKDRTGESKEIDKAEQQLAVTELQAQGRERLAQAIKAEAKAPMDAIIEVASKVTPDKARTVAILAQSQAIRETGLTALGAGAMVNLNERPQEGRGSKDKRKPEKENKPTEGGE